MVAHEEESRRCHNGKEAQPRTTDGRKVKRYRKMVWSGCFTVVQNMRPGAGRTLQDVGIWWVVVAHKPCCLVAFSTTMCSIFSEFGFALPPK